MSQTIVGQRKTNHPLCSACRFNSVCKLVSLSRTYCDSFSQKGRDRSINGVKLVDLIWGNRPGMVQSRGTE